jgi:hypothetical protein
MNKDDIFRELHKLSGRINRLNQAIYDSTIIIKRKQESLISTKEKHDSLLKEHKRRFPATTQSSSPPQIPRRPRVPAPSFPQKQHNVPPRQQSQQQVPFPTKDTIRVGGSPYYHKYMKYKQKYLDLKN